MGSAMSLRAPMMKPEGDADGSGHHLRHSCAFFPLSIIVVCMRKFAGLKAGAQSIANEKPLATKVVYGYCIVPPLPWQLAARRPDLEPESGPPEHGSGNRAPSPQSPLSQDQAVKAVDGLLEAGRAPTCNLLGFR